MIDHLREPGIEHDESSDQDTVLDPAFATTSASLAALRRSLDAQIGPPSQAFKDRVWAALRTQQPETDAGGGSSISFLADPIAQSASGGASLFAGRQIDTVSHEDVAFRPLHRGDLSTLVPVVGQALDDQFLPRRYLRWLADDPRRRLDDIKDQLARVTKGEINRAFLMGDVVIVNRAFLYGNEDVFAHFLPESPERAAFRELVATGVIVPFLVWERSPIERPTFVPHPRGFEAWQALCREVPAYALRLDWSSDEENSKATRDLVSKRFTAFVQVMRRDYRDYAREVAIPDAELGAFFQYLKNVAGAAEEEVDSQELKALAEGGSSHGAITRTFIYKHFITEGEPHLRQYRAGEPFTFALKQLVDLAYNSYLPDALGGYLLSPQDSLPRSSLREYQQAMKRHQSKPLEPDEFVRLFQRAAFATIARGTERYLDTMARLTLADVIELRTRPEWRAYIDDMDKLLNDPYNSAQLEAVRERYRIFADIMTSLALEQGRIDEASLRYWSANVEADIRIGNAEIFVGADDEGPFFWLDDQQVAAQARGVRVRVELTIGDREDVAGGLDARVELLSGTMDFPEKKLPDIVHLFQDRGFRRVYRTPIRKGPGELEEATVAAS